jgi:LPXTG-motif cell wall-anchored protein
VQTRTATTAPAPVTQTATTTRTTVVAVAQPDEGDTGDTPWAWIIVGILAGGAALGLLFWWIRSRRAAPG